MFILELLELLVGLLELILIVVVSLIGLPTLLAANGLIFDGSSLLLLERHESAGIWIWQSRGAFVQLLPGIELTIFPIAAAVSARWRLGADRLAALRETRINPNLPLLMAATLIALGTYLLWSWQHPQTSWGPISGFGVPRWVGTALAAAFPLLWLPLFPRVTAVLAGVIAGPVLFAVIGLTWFPALMAEPLLSDPPGDVSFGPPLVVFLIASLAVLLGYAVLSTTNFLWTLPLAALAALLTLVPIPGGPNIPINAIIVLPIAVLAMLGFILWSMFTRAKLAASPLTCAVTAAALAGGLTVFGQFVGRAYV